MNIWTTEKKIKRLLIRRYSYIRLWINSEKIYIIFDHVLSRVKNIWRKK